MTIPYQVHDSAEATLGNVGFPIWALWYTNSQKLLIYLSFQTFDFERTCWKLFQISVVGTQSKSNLRLLLETQGIQLPIYMGTSRRNSKKRFHLLKRHNSDENERQFILFYFMQGITEI